MFTGISPSNALACSRRSARETGSLQWRAPSTRDQSAPEAATSPSASRRHAPDPKRILPLSFRPSTCSIPQGNGSSNGSQPSSSLDNPLIPRGTRFWATACNRGSAGASPVSSSWSRRSRHQARRMAPSRESLLVETTSANARSRPQRAENAGLSSRGSCSSATLRS